MHVEVGKDLSHSNGATFLLHVARSCKFEYDRILL